VLVISAKEDIKNVMVGNPVFLAYNEIDPVYIVRRLTNEDLNRKGILKLNLSIDMEFLLLHHLLLLCPHDLPMIY